MSTITRTLLLCALVLSACDSSPPAPTDAGGGGDAAISVDAAVDASFDAGAMTDAGLADAGLDAGPPLTDAGSTTRVVVRYAGMAGALFVRGSGGPVSWTVGAPTVAEGSDTYVWETSELTEPIEFKVLLDDATWSRGPNYHVAPGEHIEIAPRFGTDDQGHVETFLASFGAAAPGGSRAVYVYLPASYDENSAARYPVLYMQDGQNLFDPSLAFGGAEWGIDETMDAAAAGGACPDSTPCQDDAACGGARCETFREAIVIGIANSGAARIDEYTPTVDSMYGGGMASAYLDVVIDDLIPRVDAALRTRTGPAETALVGSSLGGLFASWGGVERADVFGLVGAVSPSTWWDGRTLLDTVASIPSHPTRALRVYVDSGDGGSAMDGWMDTHDLAAAYRTAGYTDGVDLDYVLAPGHTHNEVYWRQRMPGAFAFLLGPRERAVP
ncbi:MAG: alpha/beta hydrolase [Sandaracinaceae bacterium]|nr:alpha/beta hydrolase [Sandaracinaceae bacterium]